MSYLKLFGGAVAQDACGQASRVASHRHALALLALLATAPSATSSRSKLVGLLWPEAGEKTARNRLTSCIYDVRSELGDAVLVSAGDDLRLDRDALDCDVFRFEEALTAGQVEQAVALYAGPFLDGFWLGGSAEFEQRMDRERDRLQRAWEGAVEQLAAEAGARREFGGAVGWWRQRAAADPYDSRVARHLMEALAAAGNRAESLRVARAHEHLLEKEFATAPDAEFRTALDRLQGAPRRNESDAGGGSDLPAHRVAVLPFANLGAAAEVEPFVAGLHDDLLTELSRIPALQVIARTSVLRYRDSDRPIAGIARELGVGTVVEGGVQSVSGRLRLNVQLIDARSGAHRWAERYERVPGADGIFGIQSELAATIAGALRAELASGEPVHGSRAPADDAEAYRLYVQGRALLDQRTAHDMYRSIDYFQRAIERQPGSALAWSGLADALSLLEFYDYAPPDSAPGPLHAARRAVELGPGLGQAHASLGIIHSIRQQGPAALDALRTAIELAPSYAESHTWLAWVHLLRGCPGEAIEPARRGLELDPLAPAYRVYMAEIWLANGEPRQALREAGRAREIQPQYGLAHFMEGLVLYHLGRFEQAQAALERALPLVPDWGMPTHAEVHAMLAVVRAACGDAAGAREQQALIRATEHPFSTALASAALGETDAAFAGLAKVRDWRSFSTEHLRYFLPDVLGPMRADPRYVAIVHGLDRAWVHDRPAEPAGDSSTRGVTATGKPTDRVR